MTERTIDDGFGNTWMRCAFEDCDLHVVRPGYAQCTNCNVEQLRADRAELREALQAFAERVRAAHAAGTDCVTLPLSSEPVRLLAQALATGALPSKPSNDEEEPLFKFINESEIPSPPEGGHG